MKMRVLCLGGVQVPGYELQLTGKLTAMILQKNNDGKGIGLVRFCSCVFGRGSHDR